MAILIPRKKPSSIDLAPERKVAEVLCNQLPDDIKVFHSYPSDREVIREGEADFVIVHPRYGIAVIEVKGGHMFYNSEEGRCVPLWFKASSEGPIQASFSQPP